MAYADQEMSGSRIVSIIIVVLIHIALGYALVTGLAYSAVKEAVKRVTTVEIEEPEPPEPEEEPPPPPPDQPVAPPPPATVTVTFDGYSDEWWTALCATTPVASS